MNSKEEGKEAAMPYTVKTIRGGDFPLVQIVGPTTDGMWAGEHTIEGLCAALNAAFEAGRRSGDPSPSLQQEKGDDGEKRSGVEFAQDLVDKCAALNRKIYGLGDRASECAPGSPLQSLASEGSGISTAIPVASHPQGQPAPKMQEDHDRYKAALEAIYHASDMGSEIEKHCIHALRITR